MKKVEVRLQLAHDNIRPVGQLAVDDRRCYFEYFPEFIQTGFNLSPFKLPFQSTLIEHQDQRFAPLPGLFDDSLPDAWGTLLMDRDFRRRGKNPSVISPLDRLLWLGTRTMGALTYHPAEHHDAIDPPALDLHQMSLASSLALKGETEDVLPQLIAAGGSPGGARPKILVGLKGKHIVSGENDLPENYEAWIVKFNSRIDSPDSGAVEYAYSLMARAVGIIIPPTQLLQTKQGDAFFAIKRFDRDGHKRFHIHSFGGMIHSNHYIPSCDYAELLKVTSLLTRNHEHVQDIFQHMVFNVLTHNRDDHVKNFAFLLDAETSEWRPTPAFDLTFSAGPGGEHSMTVLGEGRSPDESHMLKLAEQNGINKSRAQDIISDVKSIVSEWKEFADEAGVSRKTAAEIGKRICKPNDL